MKNKKKDIAKERIEYLFHLIKNKKLKETAVKMIERIRKKYNIRLNKEQKQIYCKKCLIPYEQPKIRFRKIKKNKEKKLQKIIICDHCGAEKRITF